jgi:hypothetical protein
MNKQKLSYLICVAAVTIAIACNSGNKNSKNSDVVMSQAIRNDSVITVFTGEQPYQFNKRIVTKVAFTRRLEDSMGRFYMSEVYLNRKDSMIQHYEGVGSYKILPPTNGELQGVALYNMVMDDKSKGYMYLLKDSVTLVRANENGNVLTGNEAIVLKSSGKN